MTKDDSAQAPADTAPQASDKPLWETPTIDVLPFLMTLNSTSGPSDGPYSSRS